MTNIAQLQDAVDAAHAAHQAAEDKFNAACVDLRQAQDAANRSRSQKARAHLRDMQDHHLDAADEARAAWDAYCTAFEALEEAQRLAALPPEPEQLALGL